MNYIAAFDIGVASVGWAIIDRESEKVVEAGSNIFPEATAASNQERRQMRQSRRLNRRRKTRLDDFKKLWTENYGFVIPETNDTNIVELKVKALNDEITMHELYNILRNYLKHRGISYMEDGEDYSDTGDKAYSKGVARNALELEKKFPCEIQKDRLEDVHLGKFRGQFSIKDEDGNIIDYNNVFTTDVYRKEIRHVLETQKKYHPELTDEFCDDYLAIFNRKRKYYVGPGNEQSRTDYGKYTTKRDENGEFITENNIFDKLIGKCSVYKEERRAAASSYTAQEFNILNDLNNLTINGRKLEKDEKSEIIQVIKSSNRVNMRKIIANAMGEKIESFTGARVDKNEKEIFHTFEVYNKMRKELENIGVDISDYNREQLDEIGNILTLNTDKESILEAFTKSDLMLSDEVQETFIAFRKKHGSLFSKWHSFSTKIMNELIPVMYEEPKEQMTILTEWGVMKGKVQEFEGLKYIPVDAASEDIYNPVVRRSVRITFKILNAIIKKYGIPDDVVIEMPRDKNSDDQKAFEKKIQKQNENEGKFINGILEANDIILTKHNYINNEKLKLKLKLWNEQDGRCIYSGKIIDLLDLIEKPNLFEVDHIIPRSISFDDSRNNKVLVYSSENQNKGNQTPLHYLMHFKNEDEVQKYKARVISLLGKKEYGISKKKAQNLLYAEDITKVDVLKGFINRNINDTRYASRVVLNTLQSFFKAKEEGTKVKVINGSYTHQMRVNMKLLKNREETYAHHAVDAMLIGYSQMGYEAYRKLQGEFIDFETGEILNEELWESKMTDSVYKDYLYGQKWMNIHSEIVRAEKDVKYWHFVDYKCNRSLCNQTIRGTRQYDGKTFKINKFDIRSKDGVKVFKKLAFSEKESDRARLLVYRNDYKTFENLVQIFEEYRDTANPFVKYEEETGDFVRKYAKKHNGPKINTLKYIDGEVGSCIDISHKYGHDKGSKKVILESLNPYRMDVYYNRRNDMYRLIGVKHSDIKCEEDKYVVDEEAYAKILIDEKMIEIGQSRCDLESLGYEFQFSFYKNDIIEYEKDGEIVSERFNSRTMPKKKNYIETKPIYKGKYEKQRFVGLGKTKMIKKYRTDILGNRYQCDKEPFKVEC